MALSYLGVILDSALMKFFPVPDNGPSDAHWNVQKFGNLSITSAISRLCINKVAKVLREAFAFTHREMVLVGHLGNEKPFHSDWD